MILLVASSLNVFPSMTIETTEIALLKSEALKVLGEQEDFYFVAGISEPLQGAGGGHKFTITIGGSPVEAALESTLENGLRQKLIDSGLVSDAEITVEEL